ncbi:MAG: dihydropteroate synthase [Pseudomonadota bacterium]
MPFTIIGELLNTTRKTIRDAVSARDAETIERLVIGQQDGGAGCIDVNTGAGVHTEAEDMKWLISTVQAVASVPLCIDSPDPGVIESVLDLLTLPPMINSISLEHKRCERMLDILRGRRCQVIALCMDDAGMPESVAEICRRSERLVSALVSIGIDPTAIWIDPLVGPVSTQTANGLTAMAAVAAIKKGIPGVKTVCGLSNISFGLPARRIINRTFLTLMMSRGLDGALLDPLDRDLMAAIQTTRLLLGEDDYCLQFMDSCAAGRVPV